MKNINPILIFLILCVIISCKQGILQKKEQIVDSTNTIKAITTSQSEEKMEVISQKSDRDCNQTFDDFFDRFSRDSIFQKKRIRYPMKWSYIENLEASKFKVDIVDKITDFNYIDFTKDKYAMNNEFDKYTVEIKNVDSITNYYKLLGYDNGIYMTYEFKKIDNCWYLVEIIDEST